MKLEHCSFIVHTCIRTHPHGIEVSLCMLFNKSHDVVHNRSKQITTEHATDTVTM